MKKKILIIGGAGYIGGHMRHVLSIGGYSSVVFDNLSTGFKKFVPKETPFVKGDLRNIKDINRAFEKYEIDAVMHFAASSIVPESVIDPLKYYDNNVLGCINLIKAMLGHKVKKLIFSSTAAVYGEPDKVPIREDARLNPTNPYGKSKLMIEKILEDTSKAYKFSYISLRYFNVAGRTPESGVYEDHNPETHLIPNALKAVKGERELTVFGTDYKTRDGTCIRDYIHVSDLCEAHLLALKALQSGRKSDIFNLGNGKGYSVKEVIKTIEKITGKKVKLKTGARRQGDPAKLVASSAKAKRILKWNPVFGLNKMVQDAWK